MNTRAAVLAVRIVTLLSSAQCWALCPASGRWAPGTVLVLSKHKWMAGAEGLSHIVAWAKRCSARSRVL
jgi:hypothetical protein